MISARCLQAFFTCIVIQGMFREKSQQKNTCNYYKLNGFIIQQLYYFVTERATESHDCLKSGLKHVQNHKSDPIEELLWHRLLIKVMQVMIQLEGVRTYSASQLDVYGMHIHKPVPMFYPCPVPKVGR